MFGRRGFHRGHRGHRRGNQPGLAMLLLAGQMMQVGFDRIPPVTLLTILGQVLIFLNPMRMRMPSIGEVCISGVSVWYKEDYQRLFLAAFFHLHEWHLYYNMISFLWKGIDLEKKLGSSYFAYLIAIFAVLSNLTTVGLSLALENFTGDLHYIQQCAAGFSGVLFALKVVTTHMMPPGTQMIMGFLPVHSRIACWVELIVIHVLVPNSSFTGHLAGILVGLLYVKGPLKLLMDQLHAPGPSYTYTHGTAQSNTNSGPDRSFRFSGTTGGSYPEQRRYPEPSASSSFENYGGSPTLPPRYGYSATSQPSHQANDRLYPDLNQDVNAQNEYNSARDLDDLRQRRLARLDRG